MAYVSGRQRDSRRRSSDRGRNHVVGPGNVGMCGAGLYRSGPPLRSWFRMRPIDPYLRGVPVSGQLAYRSQRLVSLRLDVRTSCA